MIRNTNNEILKNLYGVFEDLKVKLDAQSTSPNPSLQSLQRRGGGRAEQKQEKFLGAPFDLAQDMLCVLPIFIFGLRTLP